MKKLIALILALVMTVSSVTVLAENDEAVAEVGNSIAALMTLYNGTIDIDDSFTQWVNTTHTLVSSMNNTAFMASVKMLIDKCDTEEEAYRYWASIYAAALSIMTYAARNTGDYLNSFTTMTAPDYQAELTKNASRTPGKTVVELAAYILSAIITLVAVIFAGAAAAQAIKDREQAAKTMILTDDLWAVSDQNILALSYIDMAEICNVVMGFRLMKELKDLQEWLLAIKPKTPEKYAHIDEYIALAKTESDYICNEIGRWANGESERTATRFFFFKVDVPYTVKTIISRINSFCSNANVNALIKLCFGNQRVSMIGAD